MIHPAAGASPLEIVIIGIGFSVLFFLFRVERFLNLSEFAPDGAIRFN